jgi:TrmH family RNA methyltransferase
MFPIRIVLIDTAHPGNIGATARAMKNMGLRELHLVRPKQFPHADATARASGADDVLAQAVVHTEVATAIDACGLVIGTSARQRAMPWEPLEPRECAATVVTAASRTPVAILFGNERAGLTNTELGVCNRLAMIPTAEYSSLNLAMAVQILAYELWLLTRPGAPPLPEREVPLATATQMQRLYQHLEEVLTYIDFQDRTGRGHLMTRIRRLFNRAQLDQNEMNILRGILTAVQARRRPAGKPGVGKSDPDLL